MRILHLIYDDLGNPWLSGGGAVRTLEINRRLAARGLVPRLVERPLLRRFTDVLAVSEGIAEEMRAWWRPHGGGRRVVIPNSTGPAFAADAVASAGGEEPVILFLGRLDPYQKGL